MAELPEREVSSAAEWARGIARFALILFVLASAGHRYGPIDTIAFFWLLGLVFVAALVALGLAVAGFAALWTRGAKAGRASLAATFVAGAVLAPFGLAGYDALRYPALNDISTDTVEPPRFRFAQAQRDGSMNSTEPPGDAAAKAQLAAYPDATGRRFAAGTDRVLSATMAVVIARGWTPFAPPLQVEPGEVDIEVYAPTRLMRYPVDAVIRLSDEGESTFVDMRLNSRYGRHDLGDGARRIRGFMADLEAEFERQSLEIIDLPPSPQEEDAVD